MADGVNLKVDGLEPLKAELAKLAPEMRKGPARTALRAAMKPVLDIAYAQTHILPRNIFKRGKMIRRAGTLRRALKIRSSRDVNKTGDVGVFVNYKPLKRSAIQAFKEATGRRAADNPDDPFYWRWTVFATRRNKNPTRALQKGGSQLQSASLPILVEKLKAYFDRLNSKGPK